LLATSGKGSILQRAIALAWPKRFTRACRVPVASKRAPTDDVSDRAPIR
jgi:hypothetical protein